MNPALPASALVTGASSGLGAHFARVLARSGVEVLLAARRVDPLMALLNEIEADGGRARAIVMDVGDDGSIDSAFAALDGLGVVPEIVVNNAGISDARPALDISAADWDRVVDTNLRGVFWLHGPPRSA